MDLHKLIKKTCITNIKFPIIAIVVCIVIFAIVPFINAFHPTYVKDIYNIDSDFNYVNVTVHKLYYSGYDLKGNFGKDYSYYYSLENGRCIFTVIPKCDKDVVKNYSFKAKVIDIDSNTKEVIESMSKDMNWTSYDLSNASSGIVLSAEAYSPIWYMFLFWLLLIVLFVAIKNFIKYALGYFNPEMYPICSFLGRAAQKDIIDEASSELDLGMYLQINDMYITENYFVNLSENQVSIIPLSDVIWCYRLGKISILNGLHEHKYSLHFTIRTGAVVTVTGKTSDEALELINAIKATEYDIVVGHSDAKKRMAKKRLSEAKKILSE